MTGEAVTGGVERFFAEGCGGDGVDCSGERIGYGGLHVGESGATGGC